MFDGFTFASEVRLGRLARFDGLAIPRGRTGRLLPISFAPGCPAVRSWVIASALAALGS
jgi:hypothetical protein